MSSNKLKMRVLKAKEKLPSSGLSTLFFHQFSDKLEDTKSNRAKLNNVLQTRSTDSEITELLEELVEKLSK